MEHLDNCYECTNCHTTYPLSSKQWRCSCGGSFILHWNTVADPDRIASREPSLWRYRESYPIIDDRSIVSFSEGFTPLVKETIGKHSAFLKVDYLFPSGSFKDRGASILVSRIKELGITRILEDSSGNAGGAIAAYGAKAGIKTEIYVPEGTSQQKVAQLRCYGADVHTIPGNREQTAAAALRAAESIYYAGHSWNPLFFHGTKSFAYEVCEQLGWKAPDAVIIPTGNGTLFLGAYIGFKELAEAGIIGGLPKLIAVQSSKCAPLYHRFYSGEAKAAAPSSPPAAGKNGKNTAGSSASGNEGIQDSGSADGYVKPLAEGIAIAAPIREREILEAVRETDGEVLTVDDASVREAFFEIGEKGYYIEPTSATAIAGFKHYREKTSGDTITVIPLTGSGLKSSAIT
jgi:threonine synthase